MEFAAGVPPIPGDLDAFLLEGDDQTWTLDDWHWDPAQLSAAPREVPTLRCCQAFKRQQLVQGSSKPAAADAAAAQFNTVSSEHDSTTTGHMEGCMAGMQHVGGGSLAAPAVSAECSLGDKWSPSAYLNMMLALPSEDFGGPAAGGGDLAVAGHPHFLAPHGTAPFMSGVPMPMAMAQPAEVAAWPAGGTWPATSLQHATGSMGGGQPSGGLAGHHAPGGGDGTSPGWMSSFLQHGPAGVAAAAGPSADMFAAFAANPHGGTPFAQQQQQQQQQPAAVAASAVQHTGCCARPRTGGGCASRHGPGPAAMPSSQPSSMSTHMPTAFAAPVPRTAAATAGRTYSSPFATAGVGSVLVKPSMSVVEVMDDAAASDGSDDEDDGRASVAPGQSRRQGNAGSGAAGVPASYTGDLSDVAVMLPHDEAGGTLTCQVAGCGKDLTGLKEWCQRCRICEVHVKLPQVLRDGQLQRFCQQCGRFHELSAFDVNRKSCREQLGKHNARRRRQKLQAKSKAAAQAAIPASNAAAPDASAPQQQQQQQAAWSSAAAPGGLNPLVSALLSDPLQLQALRRALALPTHPALPTLQPYRPPGQGSGEAVDPPSYALARSIQDGRGEFAPAYISHHCTLRISAKLFGKTPADLPQDLREQMTGWLSSAPVCVEGAIRPGCVFLTLQLLVDKEAYAGAAASGVAGLVSHLLTRTGCTFWHDGSFSMQVLGGVCVVANGAVVSVAEVDARHGTVSGSGSLYPALTAACSAAVGGGWVLDGSQPAQVVLQGLQLDAPGTEVICRYGGRQLRPAWARSSSTSAVVQLPALGPDSGVLWVELVRGGYLSAACPLLVADDPALVEELGKLPAASPLTRSRAQLEGLLVDLALLLQSAQGGTAASRQLPAAALSVKARRMLALAFDMGWAGMASRLLPLASAGCHGAAEAVAAVEAACAPSAPSPSLSLLHRAVRGGSVALVAGVLAWGKQHGLQWRPDLAGPGDVTPLHLAALLEQPVVALMLLDNMADGRADAAGARQHPPVETALTALAAPDGVTPFHLAFQMGYWTLDRKFLSHLLGPPAAQAASSTAKRTALSSRTQGGPESDQPLAAKRTTTTTTAGLDALWLAPGDDQMERKRDKQQVSGRGLDAVEGEDGVDPCAVCRSTVAPLVLSVTAACTDCGQRQPCLNEKGCGRGVAPGGSAGRISARDTVASAVLSVDLAKASVAGTSHHLSLFEDARLETAGFMMRHRAGGTAATCQHSHGPSYSITAICQSCHANRVLAVA